MIVVGYFDLVSVAHCRRYSDEGRRTEDFNTLARRSVGTAACTLVGAACRAASSKEASKSIAE